VPNLVSRFLRRLGLGDQQPGRLSPVPLGKSGNKVGPKGGHRGMAFGRVSTAGGDQEDVSPANRARWEKLGDSEAANFVYNGEILFCHSSNVQAAQYDIDRRELIVSYLPSGKKPGAIWAYDDVSEDEAISFVNAHSKGSWTWDNLRVRGTVHQHKKPARQIA
jgi:hypothetical protein